MSNQIQCEEVGRTRIGKFVDNVQGKVGVPILLYFFGVPGIVCVLLWVFIFRGK